MAVATKEVVLLSNRVSPSLCLNVACAVVARAEGLAQDEVRPFLPALPDRADFGFYLRLEAALRDLGYAVKWR